MKDTVVLMAYCAKNIEPKIVPEFKIRLTAKGMLHRIIINCAIFNLILDGVKIVKLAENIILDDVQKATSVKLI